jgi:hypothetical protein
MPVPLETLIESMPHRGSRDAPLSVIDGDTVQMLALPADYVWPDLSQLPESGPSPSPIVLITAPGAMGKSAAAKTIASSIAMPYLDLAKVRVGSGTVTGELGKALGYKVMGQFVEDLKQGRTALILDSNDEAQLAVGRDSYLAFLNDLVWLLADAVPANQVVLLGRRDATETTQLALMELGLQAPCFQVEPLSHRQASDLIDRTLDARQGTNGGSFTVHRQHSVPFAELRDAVFRDLAAALDPSVDLHGDYWTPVAGFLGYPPVVLALAERLAVENPSAHLESLERVNSDQPVLRGALLRRVLEQIMSRESDKVRDRLGESLAIREDDPERFVLYDRDEQAARLLHLTGTIGVHLDRPASLDDGDRARYEELIQNFVLDHPFLFGGKFANVVFSDYVRAWAVSSTLSGLYASSRAEFLATLPAAGPFFSHFLHALSAADGMGVVPEDLVNDAIHSYALGLDAGGAIYMHQERALLSLWDESAGPRAAEQSLDFAVVELSGVVTLSSPIARVVAVTDHAIILQGVDGNLDLGPEVAIIAETVEINARQFSALTRWNTINAKSVTHPSDLKVSAVPATSLAISWDDPWHQWKPYVADLKSHGRLLPRGVGPQITLCLRRVLTSFRSSVSDDPSIYTDKMDHVIVGTNPAFVATLEALQGMGLVSRDGGLYRLNLEALGAYGVSWATLNGNDPLTALQSLYSAVIERPEIDRLRETG